MIKDQSSSTLVSYSDRYAPEKRACMIGLPSHKLHHGLIQSHANLNHATEESKWAKKPSGAMGVLAA